MSTENLSKVIHPSWAKVLSPIEPKIASMSKMLYKEHCLGKTFEPPLNQILRVFRYSFDEVKVLLLGQDPYPTHGDAVGLSFSVNPDRPLPRSLQNIYKELCSDIGCKMPQNGDLSPWCDQGVMLLNRTLSVETGFPASHANRGWEEVTQFAIEKLAERNKPLVAILWGRHAQTAKPYLKDTPVIASAHPSPLSASRGFFGSKPFSKCNELLLSQGSSPIKWDL
ncbi:uracil-DNA glycosylase [Actinomyces sp. zg-332]|uniref:uracil-DNA glycosylase n=1 Tax=Actinomyces sp. zg-332 TaxID=2708340 RepID=UPI0014205FC0|nr:uracil-DNA glycosylase [Actinomyces sp. zg-332]QPK93977.1 uracil-DNA glycosylase [Actinomyces sp. zg-332]